MSANQPEKLTDLVVARSATWQEPLHLEGGATLAPVTIAYEQYGELNAARDNVVLVLHALSGDAHVAGKLSSEDRRPGWWDGMIGPGKPFDTDRYCVICSNVLAGCKGSTGPSSVNPATNRPYGSDFPVITIGDMVRLQKLLIDSFGITRLLGIAGGSMGGMQVLEWAVRYPEAVASAIPIASTARHSAQQIAFNEVARQAIMADPDWSEGNYYDKKPPGRGLAVARMVGHITYMSDESMRQKFGRRQREENGIFEVESYLRYRGSQFVDRFDANSYLFITKAMDMFDLANGAQSLVPVLAKSRTRYLIISFTSDWLYPSYQSLEIVSALRRRN
ncbi:MAG: homoserine O-acetyltransferase, partial [Chloroflexales bacterium]|nr:homoserine O-acetyltransferase [Chloroflexales bacterium]